MNNVFLEREVPKKFFEPLFWILTTKLFVYTKADNILLVNTRTVLKAKRMLSFLVTLGACSQENFERKC